MIGEQRVTHLGNGGKVGNVGVHFPAANLFACDAAADLHLGRAVLDAGAEAELIQGLFYRGRIVCIHALAEKFGRERAVI